MKSSLISSYPITKSLYHPTGSQHLISSCWMQRMQWWKVKMTVAARALKFNFKTNSLLLFNVILYIYKIYENCSKTTFKTKHTSNDNARIPMHLQGGYLKIISKLFLYTHIRFPLLFISSHLISSPLCCSPGLKQNNVEVSHFS